MSFEVINNVSALCGKAVFKFRQYVLMHKFGIIFFLIYVVLVLITLGITWWKILQVSAGAINKNTLIVLVPLFLLYLSFFCIGVKRWRLCPAKIFLIIAIPALAFFTLFLPPNQVPDEIKHLYRVFDYLLPNGGTVVPNLLLYPSEDFPTNYAMVYSAIEAQHGWGDTVFVPNGLDNYLAHLYFLPGLVADVAQFLDINPILAVFLARFTNAVIFAIVGYWIIRIIPLGKVPVCIYLLNPMLIQQEASCSADAMVNVITLFYLTYLIKLVFSKHASKWQFAILTVASIFMCLSKYAYAPLIILWLLLVKRVDNNKCKMTIYITSGVSVFVALLGVVLFYNGESYQESFALVRNIPEFIRVMFNTANEMTALWIKETFGMILGSLNIVIWEPCFWAYMLLLLFSTVFNLGEEKSLLRSEKIFIITVSFFVTTAMILVFREWTLTIDQRSDVIMGIQGRYFLPYFILPLLCLISPKSSLVRQNIMVFSSAILACIYLIDIVSVIYTFS